MRKWTCRELNPWAVLLAATPNLAGPRRGGRPSLALPPGRYRRPIPVAVLSWRRLRARTRSASVAGAYPPPFGRGFGRQTSAATVRVERRTPS